MQCGALRREHWAMIGELGLAA